jgi:hypothetical protein
MEGSSPEEDKDLRQSQAAIVQAAAVKAETLYARLGEISGSAAEPGDPEASALQRRADTLSRFVNRYSHLLEDAEVEEESEELKEVKVSPKAWEAVEEAVASVIMHDGRIEKDENGSPINALMEENEWSRSQWDLMKPAAEKLGVLSLNRKGTRHTPYDSITIEMDNIIAIEALIAEGKLPEYLLEPLRDIKVRKAQEAVETAAEDAVKEDAAAGQDDAEEPTPDELEQIETSTHH